MKAAKPIIARKRLLLLEIVCLFGGPLYALETFTEFKILRYLIMGGGTAYLLWLMKQTPLTLRDLGLRRTALRQAGTVTVATTVVAAFGLIALFLQVPAWFKAGTFATPTFPWPLWQIILGYVLLSVPLQELIFRGLMIPRVELVTQNRWAVIVITAGLFGIAHIMFDNWLLCLLTFTAGLWWGWLFVRYRNLWPIQFSHAVLGSLLIVLLFRGV